MDGVYLQSLSEKKWALTNSINYATNGYPTRGPQTANPFTTLQAGLPAGSVAGDGVISFGDGGEYSPYGLALIPIGTGSNDNTFSLTILGWRPTGILNVGGSELWVPITLGIWAATLGAATGVANADLGTTTFFADTITCTLGPTYVTSGTAPVFLDWGQLSPTGDAVGMIFCRSMGFRFMEVIFTTGGSATNCNALYCKY